MFSATYRLSWRPLLLMHRALPTTLLADYQLPENPELDARVRSGDYFITLATVLESIATELPETSIALNRLAKDLDYIQRHYRIVKKVRPDKLTELH